MRQLANSDYLRLKAAFRRIVKQLGGVTSCAEICDTTASNISEQYSPNLMNRFPRADFVMDLESELGATPVTDLMQSVVKDTATAPAGYDPEAFLLHLQMEVGQVAQCTIEAAADGHWTQAEYDRFLSELADVIELAQTQHAEISGAKARAQLRAVGE